eukprot:sb/3468644/
MCGQGVWSNDCSNVLHPNGQDSDLTRYALDWDYLRSEAVGELLNFCPDTRSKHKLMAKASNQPKFHDIMIQYSEEIRTTQFDPEAEKCHSNYSWYVHNIHNEYISYDSDQFDFVGEIMSVSSPGLCIDMGYSGVVGLYNCRSDPLTVMDNHLVGFTKNGQAMTQNGCWDTFGSFEPGSPIKLTQCHVRDPINGAPGNVQTFRYDPSLQWIRNGPSNRCVTVLDSVSQTSGMEVCDPSNERQKWTIKLAAWFEP